MEKLYNKRIHLSYTHSVHSASVIGIRLLFESATGMLDLTKGHNVDKTGSIQFSPAFYQNGPLEA